MTRDSDNTDGTAEGLSQFEKNRFFKGKLMTPRDMEAEQAYHAERLHAVNRFVSGSGIVRGLDVRSVTETDEGLDVTVGPGFAIDGKGRPIVVEQVTTKSLPLPADEEAHVFIQFHEVAMETVPVPDTEGALEEEAAPNRTVEVFELTCHETPPEDSGHDLNVDVPLDELVDTDPEAVSTALARQYHDRDRSAGDTSDPAVFLGSFERTPDGNWVSMDAAPPRTFVYDQEFLFATLVDHISDTDNPHRTPVTQEPMDVPEDVDEILGKLESLEAQVDELEADRQSLTRYTLRKTIKDRIRFFGELAERVEHQSGESSRLARTIADRSREELETFDAQKARYKDHLDDLVELLIELGDHLEPVITEESLEHYLRSVSNLQSAVENDASLLDLVETHDQVCEAADSLEILLDVVPDS
jgi:hypothetical protein